MWGVLESVFMSGKSWWILLSKGLDMRSERMHQTNFDFEPDCSSTGHIDMSWV